MDSGDNTEAGDTSGTSGDKPGDAAGQGSHNQELPSESENGTGGKDSRPQKVTENIEAENPDYDIEYISQQKIENPETVFYEGRPVWSYVLLRMVRLLRRRNMQVM